MHGDDGRRSAQEWAKLVRSWRASHDGASAFAGRHGVNAATLKWWAWKLGASRSTATSGRGAALAIPKAPRLVPVRVTEDASPAAGTESGARVWCEITTAADCTVRVFEGTPLETLRAVLEVSLDGPRSRRR